MIAAELAEIFGLYKLKIYKIYSFITVMLQSVVLTK